MFIPKKQYEVIVIVPKKYTDALISELGEQKIVEIKDFDEEYNQIATLDKPEIRTHEGVKALMRLDFIIEKLKIAKGEPVDPSKHPLEEAEKLVEMIEKISGRIEKDNSLNEAKIELVKSELEFIRSIRRIKIEGNVSMLFMTEKQDWETVTKKLKSKNIFFSALRKRVSGDKVLRFITVKDDDKITVAKILANIDFYEGNIRDIEDQLKRAESACRRIIQKNDHILKRLPIKYGSRLLGLKEQIHLNLKTLENKRKFLSSEFTTLLNFWVPVSEFNEFKKTVKQVTGNSFVIYKQKAKKESNPPSKLSNFMFFKPFEFLLEGFSLPGYNEIDPTFIIALFFPIFFGIMLSDVGYGILLLLLSVFVWLRVSKTMGSILMICGAVTIIVGLYFGSWFGYPLTRSYLNPLQKPIELMIISLVLGVFYVNLSLFIGLVQSLLNRDWKFMLYDSLLWFVFELGVVFVIKPEFYRAYISLPLGPILIIIPIVVRMLVKGFLNVLDFPKFFSTMISFVRLSALAMSTAWISFAINLIYKLTTQVPNGFYAGIGVLVIGHGFNFAFNTFGSFLQAMRLHYVEFLGQFYHGKGRKMDVFSLDHKYLKRC